MPDNEVVKTLLEKYNIDTKLVDDSVQYKAESHGEKIHAYYITANEPVPIGQDEYANQEYFYRAMSYEEAARWAKILLNHNSFTELEGILGNGNAGIHFATGESYSKSFIRVNTPEAVLLEFKAPGLVKRFDEIGVGRKNEGGSGRPCDMSYGIGKQETVALKPTDDINDKVDTEYQNYKDHALMNKLREWWKIAKETDNRDDKRKLLKVPYFLEQLKSIRIVYIRNS